MALPGQCPLLPDKPDGIVGIWIAGAAQPGSDASAVVHSIHACVLPLRDFARQKTAGRPLAACPCGRPRVRNAACTAADLTSHFVPVSVDRAPAKRPRYHLDTDHISAMLHTPTALLRHFLSPEAAEGRPSVALVSAAFLGAAVDLQLHVRDLKDRVACFLKAAPESEDAAYPHLYVAAPDFPVLGWLVAGVVELRLCLGPGEFAAFCAECAGEPEGSPAPVAKRQKTCSGGAQGGGGNGASVTGLSPSEVESLAFSNFDGNGARVTGVSPSEEESLAFANFDGNGASVTRGSPPEKESLAYAKFDGNGARVTGNLACGGPSSSGGAAPAHAKPDENGARATGNFACGPSTSVPAHAKPDENGARATGNFACGPSTSAPAGGAALAARLCAVLPRVARRRLALSRALAAAAGQPPPPGGAASLVAADAELLLSFAVAFLHLGPPAAPPSDLLRDALLMCLQTAPDPHPSEKAAAAPHQAPDATGAANPSVHAPTNHAECNHLLRQAAAVRAVLPAVPGADSRGPGVPPAVPIAPGTNHAGCNLLRQASAVSSAAVRAVFPAAPGADSRGPGAPPAVSTYAVIAPSVDPGKVPPRQPRECLAAEAEFLRGFGGVMVSSLGSERVARAARLFSAGFHPLYDDARALQPDAERIITFPACPADAPLVPDGFFLFPEFLSQETHDRAVAFVEPTLTEGKAGMLRKIAHFGFQYRYPAGGLDVENPIGELPALFEGVARRIEEVTGSKPGVLNQVTANHYLPGQGISPHLDDFATIGELLCTVSLVSRTVMVLTNRATNSHCNIVLEPRSLAVFTRSARLSWTHGIPKRAIDPPVAKGGKPTARGPRISLTFRNAPPMHDWRRES